MKRSSPMKRVPLKRKRSSSAKSKAAKEEWRDSEGVAPGEVSRYLRGPVSGWVVPPPVRSLAVLRQMHDDFSRPMWTMDSTHHELRIGVCWFCGIETQVEIHHIVANAGKSDERCALVMAGGRFGSCKCHTRIQDNPEALKEVLRAKFKHDHGNLSYRRICELRKKLFPFDTLDEETSDGCV